MVLSKKAKARYMARARTYTKPIGYSSKRARKLDRSRTARYRPRKKYKRGVGNEGDWSQPYDEEIL